MKHRSAWSIARIVWAAAGILAVLVAMTTAVLPAPSIPAEDGQQSTQVVSDPPELPFDTPSWPPAGTSETTPTTDAGESPAPDPGAGR